MKKITLRDPCLWSTAVFPNRFSEWKNKKRNQRKKTSGLDFSQTRNQTKMNTRGRKTKYQIQVPGRKEIENSEFVRTHICLLSVVTILSFGMKNEHSARQDKTAEAKRWKHEGDVKWTLGAIDGTNTAAACWRCLIHQAAHSNLPMLQQKRA